jgi:hypothetical protein
VATRAVLPELLAHLGVAGDPTRTKDGTPCTFDTTMFEVRYRYGNHDAFLGESWLEDDDPLRPLLRSGGVMDLRRRPDAVTERGGADDVVR